jgi:predicted porin
LNKKLIGLGMLLAANGAFAQTASPSSVEIFGIIDIGVGHSQHSLSEDSNFPVNMSPVATKAGSNTGGGDTGMFNGGLSPSRIGFKGSEDLGGGLRAVFTLETGFNSPNGVIANGVASLANNKSTAQSTVSGDSSLAGQLFNRQANVGLASSWGTLTLGRNYSFGYETLLAYDPMEGSQTFSPLGYSGSYGGGGFTEDFRIDNSIKYKFQSNGINVGALYKLGGQAGSTNAQSEFQFNLGYENGPFGVSGTYSAVKDGISAANSATAGAVNITVADTTSYMLAASYKMDPFKLRGGYERMNFNNPSNPGLDAGITSALGYPVGAAVNVTAYNIEKTFDVYFVGLTYDVTPAFSTTVAYYDVKQNNYASAAAPCTTGTNVATCSGKNQFYSLLGDYKLSKRTHLYAGYMYNKVDGGIANGYIGSDSNGFVGAGMKHSF